MLTKHKKILKNNVKYIKKNYKLIDNSYDYEVIGIKKINVAIITIFDDIPNYGNRLQNYAVNEVLSGMGLNTTTLYVEPKLWSFKNLLKYFIHKITNFYFTKNYNYWRYDFLKSIKFNKFNTMYIPNQQIKSLKGLKDKYDYFVIGSDQVWNPNWYERIPLRKEVYLLNFVNPEQKICFSPSFGLSELPNDSKQYFKKTLGAFLNISVREKAGAKIVKELTGKDPQILIDPTLMLNKEDWINIEKKPKDLDMNCEYIFTYFLGGKSDKQQQYIDKIAIEHGLKVYNLLDYNQPELYVSDPAEFIYLIHNAKIVFTDSFHACVFSFIFEKPFQVFQRNGTLNSMMSRIETLLKTFSMERKLFKAGTECDIFESDYNEGFKRLKQEQDKVNKFLKVSFTNKTCKE